MKNLAPGLPGIVVVTTILLSFCLGARRGTRTTRKAFQRSSGLLFGFLLLSFTYSSAQGGFPYSDRYEAWSANHAFPLGAWYEGENPPPNLTVPQVVQRYRDAGLTRYSATWTNANSTTYVPHAESIGMDWLLIAPTPSTYQTYVTQAMAVGSGPSAIIVADEPTNNQVHDVADRVEWTQQQTQVGVPHAQAPLVYANLSALGFNIDNYLIQAPVDVLSYDRYPLFDDGSTDSNYFLEMGIVRRKGLQYNIPTWMIQQAMGRPPGNGQPYRLPSESDMRFQAFSFLAHGGLGIDFFFYLSESFPDAMIDHDTNQPTEVYYSIQNMAPEILNLGRSLPRLRSVGEVEFLGSALNEFSDVTPFVSTGARKLYNIEGADSALVSFSKDRFGEDYFMLVNLLHGAGLDKAEATDTFTLFFDPSVNYLRRLNRLTGQVEELPTIDNPSGGNRYLTISLEGGTGDLFQLPTGRPFAMVPVPGDFNEDGSVDAADYITWRKTSVGNYSDWRDNFGRLVLSSGAATTVPEPCTIVLAYIVVAFTCHTRKVRHLGEYHGQCSTPTID